MKYLLKGFVLVLSLITASCTDTIDTMIPPLSDSVEPVRIYLGLQEDDAETRLIHQEVKAGERTVIKTLWETDDIIIANPTPNSETDAYHFKLVDGQGSSRGVFECTQFPNNKNPETRYSNAWTIYFPGDKIQGEGDCYFCELILAENDTQYDTQEVKMILKNLFLCKFPNPHT